MSKHVVGSVVLGSYTPEKNKLPPCSVIVGRDSLSDRLIEINKMLYEKYKTKTGVKQ